MAARIQPELGRLTNREGAAVAADELEEMDLVTEEVIRQPRAPRTTNRPATLFRPTEAVQNPDAVRVDSHLTALQKKVDQLAQAQSEQNASDLQKALDALQQIQEDKKSDQIEKLLQQLKTAQPNGVDPTKLLAPKADAAAPTAPPDPLADDKPAEERKAGSMRFEPSEGQSDRFDYIDFDDVDIGQALSKLGVLSGMNILVGRGVVGRVPAANLQNVTAEEALDAITKSLGYVYEREGNFVFVWTAIDSQARKQAARKTLSRVFRPRYVSVKDLQTLITPMLSKPAGLIAVTTPAEIGLEESKAKVGGNSLSQTDALLVVDYPEVIAQVEAVLAEIDVPPAQVVIEAMILSVKLTDSMKMGVNFALLNGQNKQLVTSGNGSTIKASVGFPNNLPDKSAILPVAGDFVSPAAAGLKYGFLYGDLAGFVDALETLAETSVIASPSVRVLNKQKAELIIGSRLGYKTITNNGVQSIENINFLEVGTKLILRPFVSEDGLVRMEI
jgi:type IV pilus assembly protein PilQ